MACDNPQIRKLQSLFELNLLSDKDRANFENHLLECDTCYEVCPYGAPSLVMKRGKFVSEINEALCKGCGLCVAGCRGKAIILRGFNDTQLLTQLETLLQFSMS